jgi:hypothetical protein
MIFTLFESIRSYFCKRQIKIIKSLRGKVLESVFVQDFGAKALFYAILSSIVYFFTDFSSFLTIRIFVF